MRIIRSCIRGYMVLLALRFGLTVAVGWVALDYAQREFETVSDALHAIVASLPSP